MDDEQTPMSSSPSATSTSPTLHTLADIGKRYFESYNSQVNLLTDIEPLMLPPAPKQKHVDNYNEKDLKTKMKKTYDSNRVDYEAECDVYGALGMFNQQITVLHSFKYSSDQWKAFVGDVVQAKEGEHDFIVIFPNNVVVCIEVKRPKSYKSASYKKAYQAAANQLERFGTFLNGISNHLQSHEKPCYLKFCAFSRVDKEDLESEKDFVERSDIPILWKKDFHNLSNRLGKFVTDCGERQPDSDIEVLLTGIWLNNCSGLKDGFNEYQLVGYTINDINERLKRQELYLNKKNRPENLVPVPKMYKNIFADHLHGIEYITRGQEKLLESQKENPSIFVKPYIFVNGPAGSGKTLMMYARILKLLECMGEDEQILMLLPWEDAAESFMEIVKQFNDSVTVEIIDLLGDIRKHKDNHKVNLTTLLSDKMEGCTEKVVIFVRPNFHFESDLRREFVVSMQKRFLRMLKDKRWHIFCDDFHSAFAHSMSESKTSRPCRSIWMLPSSSTDFLFDMLSTNVCDIDQKPRSLWISCDLMQTVQFGFWGKYLLHKVEGTFDRVIDLCVKHRDVSLSGNLRNHYGIATLLVDLMDKFLEMSGGNRVKLQQILPRQGFNHYIQGFTTKLYCVLGKESNLAEDRRMTKIIRKELKLIHRSYEAVPLHNYKLAVITVYLHISDDVTPAARRTWFEDIRSTVKLAAESEGLKNFDVTENFVDYVKYAVSIEFPCAVLIIDLSSPQSKDTAHSSNSFEHSLMNILAHIYVGVSRARVYCSIILICSDDEPNELYKEVLNILKPHVKTIEVRQKDIISSTPVHSSSHNRHRQTYFLPSKSKTVLILCDRKNDSFDCSQLRKPIIAYKRIVRFLEDVNRHSEEIHKADIVLISAGMYDIKTNGVSASMLHDHVIDFTVQFPTTQFIFESVTALEWYGSRKNPEIDKTIDRFNKLMFHSSIDHDNNFVFFDNVNFKRAHLSADGRDLSTDGQAELSKCWIHCILLKLGIRQGDLPIRSYFKNMMTSNPGPC